MRDFSRVSELVINCSANNKRSRWITRGDLGRQDPVADELRSTYGRKTANQSQGPGAATLLPWSQWPFTRPIKVIECLDFLGSGCTSCR